MAFRIPLGAKILLTKSFDLWRRSNGGTRNKLSQGLPRELQQAMAAPECYQYRAKIASILNGLWSMFYILTGGITGALAYALNIPLLVDAALSAAWILTSFLMPFYLSYLKGGVDFDKFWKKQLL